MKPLVTTARGMRDGARREILRSAIEPLEGRVLMAADFASINGTGHNMANPSWGSAGSDLLRMAPVGYSDGISSPAGATRPSARAVSNAVSAQLANADGNERSMSAYVYAWGQFIDHDLDLTTTAATPVQEFGVSVPKGDSQFDPAGTGTQVIPLTRSKSDPATGTSTSNPRQQVNDITAWLDGSMVYGSDATTAASLRALSGGKLKTSPGNLLPIDATGGPFLAGDIRAGENPDLTSIQTLFLREHNRVATEINSRTPRLSDEEIFQRARQQVIGEIQAITYNEFLPALLGPAAPRPYSGYKPNVNPGIANEFSTAAYRIGHTLVGDDIEFLDNQGNEIRSAMSLADAFFNPTVLPQNGIDPILKYLASDQAQEVDTRIVDSLRNFLFGAPGSGGMDLASLNIQRGRDHGLADYNSTRAAYGLPNVTSFEQITADPALAQSLKQVYGTVDNIDLWVGGLAENHLPGSSVGPTFARIIGDQFSRTRDGDRLWYQNVFAGDQLRNIDRTTLADVIHRNSTVSNLQDNVFIFHTSISGQVFVDQNGDGHRSAGEPGAGGRIVQLLNGSGLVSATTITHPDGSYDFDDLDLGRYQAREILPGGVGQFGPKSTVINLTRGMDVRGIDLAESLPMQPPAPAPRPPRPPAMNQPAPPPPPPAMRPQNIGTPTSQPVTTSISTETPADTKPVSNLPTDPRQTPPSPRR